MDTIKQKSHDNDRGGYGLAGAAAQSLPSGTGTDIVGMMLEDYFSGADSTESETCMESLRKVDGYIKSLGLDPGEYRRITDAVVEYAARSEEQGFIAGLRYGFSVRESLALCPAAALSLQEGGRK